MKWKFTDDVPIYLQMMQQLKTAIVSGQYQAGDRLPAVRDLAAEAGVNPNTVQRAYSELEREGLVQSERTSGRFVSIDETKMEELKNELSNGYIKELFARLRALGMDDQEIRNAVKKWKEEENGNIGM